MMVCMMIGSIIHRKLSESYKQEEILKLTLGVAAVALFIPCFFEVSIFQIIFVNFMLESTSNLPVI